VVGELKLIKSMLLPEKGMYIPLVYPQGTIQFQPET